MACHNMFPACSADMLLTLRLKTCQVGNVYDRLVSFQVWSVCMYSLLGGGGLVVSHDRLGSSSRQDGNSVEQEKKWTE